ncbi:MAG: aspartyl protease family protein [Treponema sp.]|jgi:clan AA aspartic protease|nr:aspartyl protease family protein [Treponema sp.]
MGTVYEDIILKNTGDVIKARDRLIPEHQVRIATVTALVDTGAGTIVISEAIRQKLGLVITGLRQGTLADGASAIYQVTEPVDIHWQDRECTCRAVVVPNAILLGAIPLEDMDLIVDPKGRKLIGAHGRDVLCLLK